MGLYSYGVGEHSLSLKTLPDAASRYAAVLRVDKASTAQWKLKSNDKWLYSTAKRPMAPISSIPVPQKQTGFSHDSIIT